jgi:GT2 family glycosyltransferase
LDEFNYRARVVNVAEERTSLRNVARGKFVGADTHAAVAAVVVTYNSASDIPMLIDDLRVAADNRPIRLIVVDNQSSDDTVAIVRSHHDITLVESGGNLGYGGGMNAGLRMIGCCDAVLILNPDLSLAPEAVARLLACAAADHRIGAVVPLMLDEDGTKYPSLRCEPSVIRAIGDALFGAKIRGRPGFLSSIDYRATSYFDAHDVDWATGAALLVPATVAREVGDWYEDFFLYSEEIDYCRRIRELGYRIRFEPSAVVKHRRGGSGVSSELAILMAVNQVRYVELHHGRVYSAAIRAVVAMGEGLRSYNAVHRRAFAIVLNRRRWDELPRATKTIPAPAISGPRGRGAMIVPAFNESAVIKRTLAPLSQSAVDGFIEVVVVCNGCTDDTASLARSVPGVRVLELEQGSKPAALNAGDRAATLWPRLYLDADIQISATAAVMVLDRLGQGDVLAARPESRYDFRGASAPVRSYYRARQRIPQHKLAMWGAGVYGLSEAGHQRVGTFPMITGDDLYVDTLFEADEKAVVATDPSVVKAPANVRSLLAILRRGHRGGVELLAGTHSTDVQVRDTAVATVVALIRTIRGPQSALDAAVYLSMALAGRLQFGSTSSWERDESSRSSH